jgi:hypothetical protein
VTLTLSVNPTSNTSANLTICTGDSVFLDGAYQTTSGVFVDSFLTGGGCDSIITTNLTVSAAILTNHDHHICQGDSFLIAGTWQATAGVYSDTLQSTSSCDSIVLHNLIVNQLPNADIGPDTLWVCDGEELTFTLDTTGVASYSISNFFTTSFNAAFTFTFDSQLPASSVVSQATGPTGCTSSDQVILIDNQLINLTQTFPVLTDPFVAFDIAFMPDNADFWYWSFGDGDTLSGTTNPTHEYLANGNYQACLIAINECGRDSSCVTFDITTVGMTENSIWDQVSVYPNPNAGLAFISDLEIGTQVTVFSSAGQIILQTVATTSTVELNLMTEARGVYFVQLSTTIAGVVPGVFRVIRD